MGNIGTEVIDIKKRKLAIELTKPKEEQNKKIIKRLKDNIKRNKKYGRAKTKFRRYRKRNWIKN